MSVVGMAGGEREKAFSFHKPLKFLFLCIKKPKISAKYLNNLDHRMQKKLAGTIFPLFAFLGAGH